MLLAVAATLGKQMTMSLKQRYQDAEQLGDFVRRATANESFWRSMYARPAPSDLVQDANGLSEPRHLLVLLEDWCWDAVNTIPLLARVTEASTAPTLRVLDRDRNLDLMDERLAAGARAIPVVIVLDEQYREIGWWGPRPAELQVWARTHADLEKEAHYREMRKWYARDHGRSTVCEILAIARRSRVQAA